MAFIQVEDSLLVNPAQVVAVEIRDRDREPRPSGAHGYALTVVTFEGIFDVGNWTDRRDAVHAFNNLSAQLAEAQK